MSFESRYVYCIAVFILYVLRLQMPGVAEEPCWQLSQRTVNVGQLAPGWRCLITAKHRGEAIRGNGAALNTNLAANGMHSFTLN